MKKEKYLIIEVTNPDYKEAKRKNATYSPQPGTIRVTNLPPQKPLSAVIKEREKP